MLGDEHPCLGEPWHPLHCDLAAFPDSPESAACREPDTATLLVWFLVNVLVYCRLDMQDSTLYSVNSHSSSGIEYPTARDQVLQETQREEEE